MSVESAWMRAMSPLTRNPKIVVADDKHQLPIGYTFGMWEVQGVTIVKRRPLKCGRLCGYPYTPVKCLCGNPEVIEVRTTNLRNKRSTCCGCKGNNGRRVLTAAKNKSESRP